MTAQKPKGMYIYQSYGSLTPNHKEWADAGRLWAVGGLHDLATIKGLTRDECAKIIGVFSPNQSQATMGTIRDKISNLYGSMTGFYDKDGYYDAAIDEVLAILDALPESGKEPCSGYMENMAEVEGGFSYRCSDCKRTLISINASGQRCNVLIGDEPTPSLAWVDEITSAIYDESIDGDWTLGETLIEVDERIKAHLTKEGLNEN